MNSNYNFNICLNISIGLIFIQANFHHYFILVEDILHQIIIAFVLILETNLIIKYNTKFIVYSKNMLINK